MGSGKSIAAVAGVAVALAAALTSAPSSDAAHEARAPTVAAGEASVQVAECSRGRRRRDRFAVFRGEMAQVPEGAGMRMRFRLLQRVSRGTWRPVRAPGLGTWHAAEPGVSRFAYRQRVVGLERATAYRVRVVFMWLDAEGARLAATVERSRPCRQRGALANLSIRGDVVVRDGPAPDSERYAARVVNVGRAHARRVDVLLRVDGADAGTRTIRVLGAHRRRVVRFLGPACEREIEVRVDPDDAVREASERDNVATTACPPAVER